MEIDRYSTVYKQLTGGNRRVETALIESRRQQVLRSIARHPHRTVLEIGCGLDPLFQHYEGFTRHVTIEPVPEFAARAVELAANRTTIQVVEGFLETSLRELEGSYDVIVASGLLHEVPSAPAVLAGIAKLCSSDTLLHINVPNMRSFHRLLAHQMGIIKDIFEPSELDRQLGHAAWFDKERLCATVQAAGFQVIDFGTYFVKPLAHAQLEAAIENGIVSPTILEGLASMTQFMPELGAEMYVDVRRA